MASNNNTEALNKELYPYIKKQFDMKNFKTVLSRFINSRSSMLYDTCPCDRIVFTVSDRDDFFNTMKIDKSFVLECLEHTFYWDDPKFRAMAAKDEFTVCVMCIIKLLNEQKLKKEVELAYTYLAFSGKFYPSMHFVCFPIAPTQYRHVMEYVVNNKLTSKFDLKREGSVIKAINNLCMTWLDTYQDMLKEFDDDDIAYMILQLRDRIKAFIKHIASEYYDAFENKEYITFDTDSEDENNYHKADSNTLMINQITEKVISNMTTRDVNYSICKYVSDSNVKTDEIKSIIETIISDNSNLPAMRELISILLGEYLEFKKDGKPSDIKFVSYSNAAKPNSKNPNIIRQKEILEIWLSETSPAYNKRKSRLSTKNSYHKAVLAYFILFIHNNCR